MQGEDQQKLDVLANDVLMGTLGGREGVAIVASEENEEPVILREDNRGVAALLRAVRSAGRLLEPRRLRRRRAPSSASSHYDARSAAGGASRCSSPVRRQIAAGYVLYGSSTMFVLTIGKGVDMFVLDPGIGAFMRVERISRFRPATDLLGKRG